MNYIPGFPPTRLCEKSATVRKNGQAPHLASIFGTGLGTRLVFESILSSFAPPLPNLTSFHTVSYAGMTRHWPGTVTPAKVGVHAAQTPQCDFDRALAQGKAGPWPNIRWTFS